MNNYYTKKLAGLRLQRCYELASPRLRQYLEAEIQHVLARVVASDVVLELGCGYGRVTERIAAAAGRVVGIDTAIESLELGRALRKPGRMLEYREMNALELGYPDGSFDVVVCLQNGVCAFGVERADLLREALRVTRQGGRVLFSTYSDKFWDERLSWFEEQAAAGLVGAVDRAASVDGVIVCKDGFRAGRLTRGDIGALCREVGVEPKISEVDESSIFFEIGK